MFRSRPQQRRLLHDARSELQVDFLEKFVGCCSGGFAPLRQHCSAMVAIPSCGIARSLERQRAATKPVSARTTRRLPLSNLAISFRLLAFVRSLKRGLEPAQHRGRFCRRTKRPDRTDRKPREHLPPLGKASSGSTSSMPSIPDCCRSPIGTEVRPRRTRRRPYRSFGRERVQRDGRRARPLPARAGADDGGAARRRRHCPRLGAPRASSPRLTHWGPGFSPAGLQRRSAGSRDGDDAEVPAKR
jgi:hypothetical protein